MADAPEVLYRLRSDLIFSPQGTLTVVKDPIGDRFVRLATAELVIAREFDGRSTVGEIEQRLASRNVRVRLEKLIAFRDKLQKLQLIVLAGEEVAQKERSLESLSSGRLARLVVIPLPVKIDPDRALAWLADRFSFAFTRPVAIAGAALIVLAAQVWLERWQEIKIAAAALEATGRTVLAIWAVTSVSVALHELAHGLATKVYGGRVRRIGMFLYYFLLIFYTDVSDAWLFRERYKQFMVMAAGAWSSFLLWSAATIVWRATIPGSGVNAAAFLFMNVNAAVSSLTLIPLVRSDGYHMLSCALDIPNLREKSFRYTSALVKRALFFSKDPLPETTPRERRIFIAYGLVAVPFMTFLFVWSGLRFFGWFFGQLKAWGLIALVSFFIVRFGILERLVRLSRSERSGGLLMTIRSIFESTLAYARSAASRFTLRRLAILGVAAGVAALPVPIHVSGRFEVIHLEPTEARTRTDGVLARVLVKAGGEVTAGDVVAKLLDADLLAERAERQAELEQVQARLELLENGYALEDVRSARIVLDEQKSALELARSAHSRSVEMHQAGFVTAEDVEEKRDQVIRRTSLLGQAEQDWLSKSRGFRQEEIKEARSHVQLLTARLATIDQHLGWTLVVADISGRVITSDDEIQARLGRYLPRGSGVVEIVDTKKLVARVLVPEHELGDVAVGQSVTLRAYQSPAEEISGAIAWIQPAVQRAPGAVPVVSAHASLEPGRLALGLGSSGMAKIECGSTFLAHLVYRRMLRSFFVELWSWW